MKGLKAGVREHGSTFPTLLWLTLGLVLAGVWTDVVGYSVNLLPADAFREPGSFNRDAFLWGRLAAGFVLIAFARFVPRIQTTLSVAVALVMSAATGILVISYHQTLLDPLVFSSVGVFISGAGYIFLVSLFYIFFAQRVRTEQAVMSIAASLVLETVFSVLVSLYGAPIVQVGIVVSAPVLVIVCYFAARQASHAIPLLELPEKARGPFKYLLLVEVVLFSVLLVLIRALSNVGIWGRERTNFIGMTELSIDELAVISFLIVAMAVCVFIVPRRRFSLQVRCVFGFVVLLCGLQMLAFANDFQLGYFFDTVTTAMELFAHLVFWMMVIECIRKTDTPPFRVVSISRPVYALLSLLWVHFLEGSEFVTSTFVMVVIYILLLAVLGMLVSERFSRGFSLADANTTGMSGNTEAFARLWGLSQRESEVFGLLMEGKKRSEIETACKLSEGTVKTHLANIYRKCDVHSKSEMAQLFNAYAQEAPSLGQAPASKAPRAAHYVVSSEDDRKKET
ncbi:MAG: helix-turn-helix transcriptional regulator [Coriobacteriaceae bacterium]|jgi:DNA-binding CsgD family transcriptional regulator|nr:helix-turn-helix transcriptional regulator [Coriobacteriaceae bacterium]